MNQALIKGTKVPFNQSSNDYGHIEPFNESSNEEEPMRAVKKSINN
jgi:hypothetical protein